MRNPAYPNRRYGLDYWLIPIVLLLSSAPIYADDIISFCFNDWPPYAIVSDANPSGISIEIIAEAGRRLGRPVLFVELAWNECLEQVREGEIDAVIDAARRDEYLQGPTSFSVFTDTFWVKNESDISRYGDLQGGKIGLVDGYSYDDTLLAQIEGLNLRVSYAKDDPANILSLARGQVDVIIADLASTFLFVRQQNLSLHPILPPFSVNTLYVSFNAKRVELQPEFDRVFRVLIEEGFVDDIYQRYIGVSYSSFVNTE
ncbi:MAG: transporter substrate-binding domain-containing protein [Gammaproteobacteria bacterium]|nr:transporter substrate-binding domain-containing protein [Gammaproteobacteria bacterium]MDH3448223.1 transporter substrate-binding domain-containing protein [Gammaproteobacteria bacterium]